MHQRRKLRVLIIGQQESFGQVLAANVRRWGYEVVALSSTMAMLPGKAQNDTEEDYDADVLLYDLDEALRISALLGGRDTFTLLRRDASGHWPRVRLVIAFSSSTVSRLTLEKIEAVAVLYKPFEMGKLQRYLQVLQRLFSPDDTSPTTSQLQTSTNIRILVVDDDDRVADAVRQCLEEEFSYRVGAILAVALAHDGIEALEQALTWRPHCIITDLIMPLMNGYQLMRCLEAASLQTVPAFVVMSALTQLEVPPNRAFLKDHVAAYVDKPFTIDQLLAAVEQALHTERVPVQPRGQKLQNVA
jgi:CheY-like chemotaxis protein